MQNKNKKRQIQQPNSAKFEPRDQRADESFADFAKYVETMVKANFKTTSSDEIERFKAKLFTQKLHKSSIRKRVWGLINLVDLKKAKKKGDNENKSHSTIKTTILNDESESSSEANVKAPPIKLRFCETCRVEVINNKKIIKKLL